MVVMTDRGGGQYFGMPITWSVVQFPLRTLMNNLSSRYIEILRQSIFLNHTR